MSLGPQSETAADVQTETHDGVLVVRITGVLDLANAETVGSSIIAEVSTSAGGVVLDLSELEFLDSVGITVIIGMRESLRVRRQSLALVVPKGSRVRGTFEAVGLLQHLRPSETVEAALSAVGSDLVR